MATTLQMFFGALALGVNTFTILTMYFVGNIILSPLLNALGGIVSKPMVVPMMDMSYIFPATAGILLIEEIVIVVSYAIIAGRTNTVDDYWS
jgi:hypothetical protein